jgi:hypothetical protein
MDATALIWLLFSFMADNSAFLAASQESLLYR